MLTEFKSQQHEGSFLSDSKYGFGQTFGWCCCTG